jgi:hypothetical protein
VAPGTTDAHPAAIKHTTEIRASAGSFIAVS